MEINLTIKNYRCFPDEHPARLCIKPGLTALIGPNNSGKSSLLRFFWEFRPLFGLWQNPNQVAGALAQGAQLDPASLRSRAELFHRANYRDIAVDVQVPSSHGGNGATTYSWVVPRSRAFTRFSLCSSLARIPVSAPSPSGAPTQVPAINVGDKTMSCSDPAGNRTVVEISEIQRASLDLYTAMYVGSFRNAINLGQSASYFDIQTGQAFIGAWKQFKAGSVVADNEAAGEVEEDLARIFGFSRFQANAGPNDTNLALMVDGRSFDLGEMGAGLAHFLITLGNVAIKKPSYLFIDEPELGLHPSLQMEFLLTLRKYVRKGIVFSTHSIGLARAVADKVYSLQKVEPMVSKLSDLQATPRLAQFLGEMSFSAYREIGFEKVLLVEGPTDVTAMSQLLRSYRKDHRVMLLQMGGNSMINGGGDTKWQLEELKRITPSISALIDRDPVSQATLPAARQAFVEACEAADVDCHVLDRRALENYWPASALDKFKTGLQPLGPFEKLGSQWAKHDNWRIAQLVTKEDLASTDLGEFLERL